MTLVVVGLYECVMKLRYQCLIKCACNKDVTQEVLGLLALNHCEHIFVQKPQPILGAQFSTKCLVALCDGQLSSLATTYLAASQRVEGLNHVFVRF